MSIRLRLFLLLGSLVTLMAIAQWWWIQGLTGDLYDELDRIAIFVGQSVASVIVESHTEEGGSFTFDQRMDEECTEPCPENPQMHFYHWQTPEQEEAVELRVLQAKTRIRSSAESPGDGEDTNAATHTTTSHSTVVVAPGDDPKIVQLPPDSRALLIEKMKNQDGEILFEEIRDLDDGVIDVAVHSSPHLNLHVEHQGGARFLSLPGRQRLPIPQEGMRTKLEQFSRTLLLGTLAFLVVGLVLAGFVADRVSAPLRQLSEAANKVGEGALGTQSPVPRSGGEVAQAVHSFNQMSQQLAALDAKTRELQDRQHLGEIGEIARGLAHTLRNPLNALGLSVEELANRAATPVSDEESTQGLAESARRQIRRIDHSIRSFLVLASQGGGAVDDVDVAALVQDVALEALQDAAGRVRLHLEGVEEPLGLRAVAPELRAVVQALLVNAVEASPEGGEVRVTLASDEEAGEPRLHLCIEDQGPGLPAEVREKLFTPHLTTKANGSGMGLFLAHRIATGRYGGRLEILKASSGGARAQLVLGARQSDLGEEA